MTIARRSAGPRRSGPAVVAFTVLVLALACTRESPPPPWSSTRLDVFPWPLEAPRIEAIRLDEPTRARGRELGWGEVLSLRVGDQLDIPAVAGEYELDGTTLRFKPLFPLTRGLDYRVTITVVGGPVIEHRFTIKRNEESPTTTLDHVFPTANELPENLLKFYLQFSAPMRQGEAYEHVKLVDENGETIELAFLELGEELWDTTGTRLTLLFDPGRIKRGVKPNEDVGPPLRAGGTRSLIVDPAWHDAHGNPLAGGVTKRFEVTVADREQPDPERWTIESPSAESRGPLVVVFAEPLDRAMLESALMVSDAAGGYIEGEITIDDGERRWSFTPHAPWSSGAHEIRVAHTLEDRAGNSVGRPFEVSGKEEAPRPSKAVTLPFEVR